MPKKPVVLKGKIVSSGIAIGKVWICDKNDFSDVPKYAIEEWQLEDEFSRFLKALDASRIELEELYRIVEKNASSSEAAIFSTQILVLKDPYLLEEVKKELTVKKFNIETALVNVIDKYLQMYEINDDIVRKNAGDITDVCRRILNNLISEQKTDEPETHEQNLILMAKELIPSITVKKAGNIKGIVTVKGEMTSHASILARSMKIPALVNIDGLFDNIKNGDNVVLDCIDGKVMVLPEKSVIKEYSSRKNELNKKEEKLLEEMKEKSITKDGVEISLMANIGVVSEVSQVLKYNGDGVGLFRTEFLFMRSDKFPSEEQQFLIYRQLLKEIGDKEVTIRVLDIASDKQLDYFRIDNEIGNMLGFRGIRILLQHRTILETQLLALFRASSYGNMRILFPMITNTFEMSEIIKIIRKVKRQLDKRKISYSKDVKIGMMIEVPSTVFLMEEFSRVVDFFSVGTNDLIQYMFAADRNIKEVAYLYNPVNPAILKILQIISEFSQKTGKRVSICGEIAGDPYFTNLLIALGFRELSMNISSIPDIKKIIVNTDLTHSKKIFNRIIKINNHEKATKILREDVQRLYN